MPKVEEVKVQVDLHEHEVQDGVREVRSKVSYSGTQRLTRGRTLFRSRAKTAWHRLPAAVSELPRRT